MKKTMATIAIASAIGYGVGLWEPFSEGDPVPAVAIVGEFTVAHSDTAQWREIEMDGQGIGTIKEYRNTAGEDRIFATWDPTMAVLWPHPTHQMRVIDTGTMELVHDDWFTRNPNFETWNEDRFEIQLYRFPADADTLDRYSTIEVGPECLTPSGVSFEARVRVEDGQ